MSDKNKFTTHDFANRLLAMGNFLLTRPDVPFEGKPAIFSSFFDKQMFIAAVRAMAPGTKRMDDNRVEFEPKAMPGFTIGVPRHVVCTKIADAKFHCEPWFSDAEQEEFNRNVGERIFGDIAANEEPQTAEPAAVEPEPVDVDPFF